MTIEFDNPSALLDNFASKVLANQCIGSFSPSVYDTAWVAMVGQRDSSGSWITTFPECLEYILDTQLADGSWTSYSCPLDGILNTLGGLLALHRAAERGPTENPDLQLRIIRAKSAAQRLLLAWDHTQSERVGFEIIVPNILDLLERSGISFDFPSRDVVSAMRDTKVSRILPLLYSKRPSAVLHSLEAFANLDYNKVKHHQGPLGDIMGPPSATAAYLMGMHSWDSKAENYLASVLQNQRERGYPGGMPSAYPTTIFEITWAITTFLDAGFSKASLGKENLTVLSNYLASILRTQDGVVGFAKSYFADADDTAMTYRVLKLLGKEVNVKPLLDCFESATHFATYSLERNASFSANCNVCLCLLAMDNFPEYVNQIAKCITYLLTRWYEGGISDKWNVSPLYSKMLLAKVLVAFLARWELVADNKNIFSPDLVREKVPIVLIEIQLQVLQAQLDDGSWQSSYEVSSYAVLTLGALSRLPWLDKTAVILAQSIRRGQLYILRQRKQWTVGNYLWIEKVAYSLSSLSQAYCLAATRPFTDALPSSIMQHTTSFVNENPKQSLKFQKLLQMMPRFSHIAQWRLDLWTLQALRFVPALISMRLEIFSRKNVEKDQYLPMIPLTWLATHHARNSAIGLATHFDMMVISMLIYQVDEYMEGVIAKKHPYQLDQIIHTIKELCSRTECSSPGDSSGTTTVAPTSFKGCQSETSDFSEARTTLKGFVHHVMNNHRVLASPSWLQRWLLQELQSFLIGHVMQIRDCQSLGRHATSDKAIDRGFADTTYFDWARSTASANTSCPFAFAYFLCQINVAGKAVLEDAYTRYIVQSLIQHLAIKCRQQNDFGSLNRDRAEGNLNSLDFAEFQDMPFREADELGKSRLLSLASYEQRCLDAALGELGGVLSPALMDAIELYIDVTNLYGEIYTLRDMSPYLMREKSPTAASDTTSTNSTRNGTAVYIQ